MLHELKKMIPKGWLSAYHFAMAHAAAFIYRYPSKKMTVIGVTGTNGKSSTVQLIGQLLMASGHKVGCTTTDSFRIGERLIANDKKMTMLGRTQTQQLLSEMKKRGCEFAIVETSSQGIEQSRHIGIDYNAMVFTNLTPEHIEAHGGFEAYKAAKQKAFRVLVGKPGAISVVNMDDEHAADFSTIDVETVVGFSREDKKSGSILVDRAVRASEVDMRQDGTGATVDGKRVSIPLVGSFYFENALAAIATVLQFNVPLDNVVKAAANLKPIPGRLETFEVNEGLVIVDYAPEPYSLKALYEVLELLEPKKIIHVTGSTGGGRDVARRAEIGKLAAKKDDIVIVTNEDPYDDDPWQIINDVADGAVDGGMKDGESLFRILDREEAVNKAVSLVEKGDIAIITGKGSEPVMCVAGGKKVPSDDRDFVRSAIRSK